MSTSSVKKMRKLRSDDSNFPDITTGSLPQHNHFSDSQIIKYKKWFHSIDTNESGSVDVGELTKLLITAGVVKNKWEARKIFKDMDTNGNGLISFHEFLTSVAESETRHRHEISRLNDYVDSQSLLGSETMLSLERRRVIMQHIVHKTNMRAIDVDWIQAMSSVEGKEERLQLTKSHHLERAESNKVLYQMKESIAEAKKRETAKKPKKKKQIQLEYVADLLPMLPPSLQSRLDVSEDSCASSIQSMCSDDDLSSLGDASEARSDVIHTQSEHCSFESELKYSSADVKLKPSPIKIFRSMSDGTGYGDGKRMVLRQIGCFEASSMGSPRTAFPPVSLGGSPIGSPKGITRKTKKGMHRSMSDVCGQNIGLALSPIQFRRKGSSDSIDSVGSPNGRIGRKKRLGGVVLGKSLLL